MMIEFRRNVDDERTRRDGESLEFMPFLNICLCIIPPLSFMERFGMYALELSKERSLSEVSPLPHTNHPYRARHYALIRDSCRIMNPLIKHNFPEREPMQPAQTPANKWHYLNLSQRVIHTWRRYSIGAPPPMYFTGSHRFMNASTFGGAKCNNSNVDFEEKRSFGSL